MGNGWAGLCRLGGVGDDLIASSVLPALARQFQVEVLTREPQGAVFENNPHIAKLTYLREGDLPADQLGWQHWFVKRSHEYEFFVNLSHSCETLVALVEGQTAFHWPASARRALCNRNYLEVVHDICGIDHDFRPAFYPTAAETAQASETKAKVGERVIGWCLAGTRIDKLYPGAALAIARIVKELEIPVVLFGAPGRELEMARQIMAHVARVNGSTRGLHAAITAEASKDSPAADWPIRRSLAQALACDLLIGPDTGPMWAVAMAPLPKLVLLSHASPENITKHWLNTVTLHADPRRVACWPCHRLQERPETCTPNAANNGAACISDISVDQVVVEASNLLKGA